MRIWMIGWIYYIWEFRTTEFSGRVPSKCTLGLFFFIWNATIILWKLVELPNFKEWFLGTDLHTTTEETIEDKNKKNWFDSSRDCCLKSKILYDKEIQNDEDTFDIIQSMNAQNFSEIFLNNKVYKGPWIVPAG